MVTVTQSVASVEVSPSVYELTASGATVQLTAEALDGNGHGVAGAEFSWESSDVAVATVDASGLVTAVRGGNATITATYEENTAESVISVWISTLSAVSVRVLYVVPADREFRDDYSDGISRAIVDVQGWYRGQLDALTFDIYRVIPEQCHLPRDEDYYSYGDVWEKVLEDVQSCAPVQHGPSQFTWALYVDVTERCGEPHELGRGGDGLTMLQTACGQTTACIWRRPPKRRRSIDTVQTRFIEHSGASWEVSRTNSGTRSDCPIRPDATRGCRPVTTRR